MNSEIWNLHRQLMSTHQALAARLGKTTDPAEAEAVLREMEEVNFRVMMAGRLLFQETTQAMDGRIHSVVDAGAGLDASIKNLEKVKDLIKSVSGFLTLVDRVLDALKLL
jgi:phosphoribosylanthranilate isomerase